MPKISDPSAKPILITKQEAKAQVNEENMTKPEILLKIETLLEQLCESVQKNYSGLKLKKQSELLDILQEVKCLFDLDNAFNDQDCLENSGTDQQE
ncbi:13488_t:CDS:2 [Ambispora gerdemannii]|uniref:13488_t:CDS:1 n=1 Tax=Ambispora gerdemannii TaxID=144530 RepID=A0A9N8VSG3_9GLOM|nr:13488_t:CDS:2 [Ambispora gerdemannii]